MPAREINPFTALTRILYQFLRTVIDEQSSASEHDYASNRSAIGAGNTTVQWNDGVLGLFCAHCLG